MRAKLLTSAAALAFTACAVLASAGPASAAPWGWRHGWYGGWGLGGLAAGVIGGAVAAATSPLWAPDYYDYAWGPTYGYAWGPAYRVYAYAPAAPVVVGGGVGWCEAHFRSYNPATGMYLGYDGVYHRCG
jgi:BA14K-like protein